MSGDLKKIVFVSYHYFLNLSYRPDQFHKFLQDYCRSNKVSYKFLTSDWCHISKSAHKVKKESDTCLLWVPRYKKNLSLIRILSHVYFSLRILFSRDLWKATVIVVSLPPSFCGAVVLFASWLSGAKVVFDVVDLWPEALPAPKKIKKVFMSTVGKFWVCVRNFCYSKPERLVTHCRYFLPYFGSSNSARAKVISLAQPEDSFFKVPSSRTEVALEIRILVLGSINHVLNTESLVRLLGFLGEYKKEQKIILEVIGSGESKDSLLNKIKSIHSLVEVFDHGIVYDVDKKSEILSRCHFGFNGYQDTTAIGVTYKSIDFSSLGVVLLNSVQGDLNDLIDKYHCGFNYRSGSEAELAKKILALSSQEYGVMSDGSKKMATQMFHSKIFSQNMKHVLNELGV